MLPVEDKNHAQHNLKLELNIENVDLNPSASPAGQNGATKTVTKTARIIHFDQREESHATTVLKASDIQRPKSLVKPSVSQQVSVMESSLNDGGSGNSGILISGSSTAGPSDEGKKVKMSKIGNNKNAALKR